MRNFTSNYVYETAGILAVQNKKYGFISDGVRYKAAFAISSRRDDGKKDVVVYMAKKTQTPTMVLNVTTDRMMTELAPLMEIFPRQIATQMWLDIYHYLRYDYIYIGGHIALERVEPNEYDPHRDTATVVFDADGREVARHWFASHNADGDTMSAMMREKVSEFGYNPDEIERDILRAL